MRSDHDVAILNEAADTLAAASLKGPVLNVLRPSSNNTIARFRNFCLQEERTKSYVLNNTNFQHLRFPWNSTWCSTRQLEVTLTKLRCRIPSLNFYLHRPGFVPSPNCNYCNQAETIEHYFTECRRYENIRQRFLKPPFQKLGLELSTSALLSLGASALGQCNRGIYDAIFSYIKESKRLPC